MSLVIENKLAVGFEINYWKNGKIEELKSKINAKLLPEWGNDKKSTFLLMGYNIDTDDITKMVLGFPICKELKNKKGDKFSEKYDSQNIETETSVSLLKLFSMVEDCYGTYIKPKKLFYGDRLELIDFSGLLVDFLKSSLMKEFEIYKQLKYNEGNYYTEEDLKNFDREMKEIESDINEFCFLISEEIDTEFKIFSLLDFY